MFACFILVRVNWMIKRRCRTHSFHLSLSGWLLGTHQVRRHRSADTSTRRSPFLRNLSIEPCPALSRQIHRALTICRCRSICGPHSICGLRLLLKLKPHHARPTWRWRIALSIRATARLAYLTEWQLDTKQNIWSSLQGFLCEYLAAHDKLFALSDLCLVVWCYWRVCCTCCFSV